MTGGRIVVATTATPCSVLSSAPTGRPHGDSWERCEQRRTLLEEKLHTVKLSKVQWLLRRQGVDIPYATLRRFAVIELGYGRHAPTIPVADTR